MVARIASFLLAWLFATAAAKGASSDAGFPILDEPEGQHNMIGGPVMAIERSAGGQLFVGSNRLAIYDGVTWRRVALPGALRVFSLASTQRLPAALAPTTERIWLGGENAIGYLQRDATGEWQFTSLKAPFAALGLGEPSEIRSAFPTRDGAVFVSRSRVIRWDGVKFTSWELPSTNRLYGFVHEGNIFVYQTDVGLLRLEADGPKLAFADATLPVHQPLVAFLRCADGSDFAVFYDDVYRLADGQWVRLEALSKLIKGRRALQAVMAGPDLIAIGTAYGGVVLSRADGTVLRAVTVQNGLGEDNVNSLLSDRSGHLWIGTGTGLSRLSGVGTASLFDQRNHLSTSVTRGVRIVEHRPWIVTARRVYRLTAASGLEPAMVNRVEMFWPLIRDVTVFRGELWVGGAGGLWRIDGNEPVHELTTDKDVYLVATPTDLPDGLLYADGYVLTARVQEDGRWRSIPLGPTLDSSPVTILEDGRRRVWISTRYGHIHVYRFEPGARRLREERHLAPGRGLPENTRRPVLSFVDGQVLALTETDILAERDGQFEPVRDFAPFVATAAVSLADGTAYWTALSHELGDAAPPVLMRVRHDRATDRFAWTPLGAPGLDQIGTVLRLSFTEEAHERVLWIGGESAVLRLEADQLVPAADPPATSLQHLRIDSQRDAPLGVEAPVFAADTSQLEFTFAASIDASEGSALFFQTRLMGIETAWSAPRGLTRREFTGLAPGQYTFQARMIDALGRTGEPASFAFTIDAPWYQRAWAIALWLVVAGTLVWGGVKWRLRQMERQTDRLNQLVGERTRELSLSNTARSEFLDSLSHEIRRPLNGIIALTGRLARGQLTEIQREQVRQLQLGSESLLRVFNEVLSISQLDYGAVALEEREFRLGHMIDAVRVECDAATALTVNIPPDFADGFLGDDAKLKSIVANFVANALKYAPGAPVEIHVTSMPAARDTADVLIEVIDGGPGVPAEEQELIFKRFVRGSRAKQAHVPGTGIGLATCRAMARLMGGSVGVESPAERAREHGWPGPGAMFFVRVPLRRAVAATVAGGAV